MTSNAPSSLNRPRAEDPIQALVIVSLPRKVLVILLIGITLAVIGSFIVALVSEHCGFVIRRWRLRRVAENVPESSDESVEAAEAAEEMSRVEDGEDMSSERSHRRESRQHVPSIDVDEYKTLSSCVYCGQAIDCVLLKCTHSPCCYKCSKNTQFCPVCKSKIHRRQRFYFA
jgi:hypothetical protein